MFTENRRIILWGLLIFSLVVLWDNWQHYNGRPSLFFGPGITHIAPVAPSNAIPLMGSSAPANTGAPLPGAPAALATSAASETVKIETDEFAIGINTLGAGIDRLELLGHRDTVDPQRNLVLFDKTSQHPYEAETGLIGAAGVPTHNTSFRLLPGPTALEPGKDSLNVALEAIGGGVRLVKTYTFKRGSYEIGVSHQVFNTGDHPIDPSLYLELVRDDSKPEGTMRFYSPYYGPAVYRDSDHFQKVSFDDIEKQHDRAKPRDASDGWVGILQHYFVAAWIPPNGVPRTYRTEPIVGEGSGKFRAAALIPLGTIAPGASVTNESRLFVGPEAQRLLEQVTPGLELVRDYGWTKLLATPVFWLLENLQALLGNWGWAIVALTVLIKAAFFPLSAASYRSMARMKNVAPRLKLLQEKYKDDRAKLNQAMMELYRTEKINPMGGCLPILIQIPVFIALYSVLSASVEMRGAPWILWIHDLAAPDPYYILPAVMMVSMFVQYKLNPAPPDPVQARMMMIMPLVFGVTFFFFPAGLVLYWVVNNLLSIAQQWQITRMMGTAKTKS
jgi:YidC/Oxa1 family membrane protein insertase